MTNGESNRVVRGKLFGIGGARMLSQAFGAEKNGREEMRVREILFVELLGGLGDTLISLQAIQALARSHPESRLTVLTFAPGGELLELDPLIGEVVQVPMPEPEHPRRAREAVEGMLARGSWDLVISDTSYDGIDDLIRASGTPCVAANLWQGPPPGERVGERFIRILLSEGLILPGAVSPPRLHLTPEERSTAAEKLADTRASGRERHPLAFLLPDAGMEVKRWPEEAWGALGCALAERHDADVVVPVGSDPEQASRVARLVGERARVWPRGKLRELAAALSHADLAVGADTGPARIATALDVPTVTLFGPSWYGRYGQPSPHENLQGHPDCPQRMISDFTQQPCWYVGRCTLENPSWKTCMEDVSVENVLDVATPFLDGRNEPETVVYETHRQGGVR